MRFLETLSGQLINTKSISAIDEFRPDKGAIWYTIRYHQGRDYAFVHPDVMQQFLEEQST
jgi:hypothetical protein